jgi:hypothetical protein
MSISSNIQEINKSNKLKESIDKIKNYNLDLNDNIRKIKEKASEYSRKDINLNFFDNFTRAIYKNPYHVAKLEFIQYMIFIALIYYYNPLNIKTKYPAFSKLLVLIIAFVYVILFFFIKLKVDSNEDIDLINPTESTIIFQFLSTIVFFILFMISIKGIIWLFINTSLVKIFNNLMKVFIVSGVLGIVYLFMRKTINKARDAQGKSVLKLILKIIMFLPCLLVDLVEYVKYEFNITTKPVWILVGVEAALVGLWFIIPYLFDKLINSNGIKLLKEPVNLNIENVISNFKMSDNPNDSLINLDEVLSNKKNSKIKEEIEQQNNTLDNASTKSDNKPKLYKIELFNWIYGKFKTLTSIKVDFKVHPQYTDYTDKRFAYKYSLSGWFYINPQPPNTNSSYATYTNILNYGKKINLEYNGKLNSLRVMGSIASTKENDSDNNESVEIYKTTDIMYQKWNNIVINYDEGHIDVFLNGALVGTMYGAVPYMSFDTIVTGSANGIMGGICNVNYYTEILSEENIKTTYRALRIKEQPYI